MTFLIYPNTVDIIHENNENDTKFVAQTFGKWKVWLSVGTRYPGPIIADFSIKTIFVL